MQSLVSNIQKTFSLANVFTRGYFRTYKPFVGLKESDLHNRELMRQILSHRFPKHTPRTVKGLFHGKKPKSGNSYSHSDQATRRRWDPNSVDREFYSEILGKKLDIEVTTKALRCMRKYGGFDNYILLTKPQKMDSLYGEYLRKMMLAKLNNPDFRVPYLIRSRPVTFKARRKYYKFPKRPTIYFPKDIRYTDQYDLFIRRPDQMTKKELAEYNEMQELSKEFQDVQSSHPLLSKFEKQREEEMKILEPVRKEAIAQFERKPNKKAKALVMDMVSQAQQEGYVRDIRSEKSEEKEKGSKKKRQM